MLDTEAQRFAQGNVSATLIVSDDSTGHSWQHTSSGAITAEQSKLLREAHTCKLDPSTSLRPELADEEIKCAPADKWPRREQEALISYFADKDEMKEFFAKVRICADIESSVTVIQQPIHTFKSSTLDRRMSLISENARLGRSRNWPQESPRLSVAAHCSWPPH